MPDLRPQRGATLVGVTLGNYRILEPLNRGGMGSVFRAEHTVLGRPAAVKVLRPELMSNPQLVQRFLNEAKAATLIRHPGIVEVYDYGTTDDGTAYIVMELLEGDSLASRLGERGKLPEAEAVRIARGVASALKAAHQQGIIHRDLKPDNIFLVPDPEEDAGERVKVLDFGIAKLIDPKRSQLTQTGALIGTPIYMPPEQARAAGEIDHRADLYSLGCMLYQMLVGRPPFVSAAAGELISMHLFNAPQPPSQLGPVSPALERIVLRLLEKEPEARYQTAAELAAALAELSDARDPAPRPEREERQRSARASGPSAGSPAGGGAISATAPAFAGRLPLSLADELGPAPPPLRSRMGLVAGLITAGIAAAVALFLVTRSSGADEPPRGGSGSGSATATEVAPAPAPGPTSAHPAPPAPAPAPAPTPTTEQPAAPTPAPTPNATPRTPRAPTAPAPRPPATSHGKGGPTTKPGSPGGPVTQPDNGPITRPDSGPVTHPSALKSPGGSPINPGESLSEDKPPQPPPPRPADPPPPPPPPPADRLPDKPSASP